LSKHATLNDDTTFEIWFKTLSTTQEKVIFHRHLKKSESQSQKAFSILKNAVLNQPFEITIKNTPYIRKLFTDMLFWLTFENIGGEGEVSKNPYTFAEDDKLAEEDDKENVYDEKLEQICQLSVITLSDIFIYYVSFLY
jgi:hypothetical protein